MTTWRERLDVRPRTILAFGVLGTVLYGYPGLMSYDSVFQLDEARRWELTDGHPPAMAALWRLAEIFVAGPFGMLLLQTLALGLGLYAVLKTELEPRRAAIASAAICWFPPVLVVMGVIWKDAQMAGYLMLGIGALLSGNRRIRWLGLGALFAASAMRHNAPTATFAPIVLLWARDQPVRWRRWLTGIAVWIAITAASVMINRLLVQKHQALTVGMTLADIMGTVRYSEPIPDAELRQILDGAPLRVDHDIQHEMAVYFDARGYTNYFPDTTHPPIAVPTTDAERAAIAHARWVLIKREPLAYLHQRWSIFARVVDLRGSRTVPPLTQTFNYPFDPELDSRISHHASASDVQVFWFRAVRWIGGIWFVPFVYLIVALCMLPFARGSRAILPVLGSGLGYELALFPTALTPDYRYSHWLILSTIVAATMVFARRFEKGRAP